MYPDLFSIGPLTVHTYGVFVAIGFLAGIFVATRTGKKTGIDPNRVLDMGFMIIVCGIIGSRAAYILINFSHYAAYPKDILKLWQGGLVFSGGLVLVVIAAVWYSRHHGYNIWTIGDLWAPAAAIGQAIGRIGCFFAGCCYGKPGDLPWCVVFSNPKSLATLNVPLHPTQLYSSLSSFLIFIVLLILQKKKKFEGQVFLWFLILHSTARLILEKYRGDARGVIITNDFSTTQLIALIILIAAVTALFFFRPSNKQ